METHILQFIVAFLVPVALSIILTPWVIKLAYKIGAIDKPDERKVHKKLTPRLGGVVIFLSLAICSVLAFLLFNVGDLNLEIHYRKIFLVATALTMVFALGIWDDIKPLKPGPKFGLQFVFATMVYFAGVKISTVMNPLSAYDINVQLIDYPLTILWIVGITNAINLIDGLDGLASGVSTIACVSIFAVSALTGEIGNAYVALILAGSLVGFLRYNFNPARIFLGDSGSLLLGFMLAILSIQSSNKVSTGFSILFPIIVLGLPITDTLIAMLRRFLATFLEHQPSKNSLVGKMYKMFLPDKSHIHHQLLAQGLTHRNTVILLYFISGFFALSAFSITMLDSYNEAIIAVMATAVIFFFGIKKLKYREIDVFNNGIFLPLYERIWSNKVMFKSLFDLLFISVSFMLSFFIVLWANPALLPEANFQIALVIACVMQASVLWITGLYRESHKYAGLGDALKVAKNVIYASLALVPALTVYLDAELAFLVPFLILNFYFMITLILGFRISYQALRYLFFKSGSAENSVLIYGANTYGQMLIDQIMSYDKPRFNVLGLIDEDPALEGTYFNGFQVYGGHWKLERLYNAKKFTMILMTDCRMKPEVMKRIKSFAKEKQIPILKFNLDFDLLSESTSETMNTPFNKNLVFTN